MSRIIPIDELPAKVHEAVARGYEQAAVTWRKRGDDLAAARWAFLAKERREKYLRPKPSAK